VENLTVIRVQVRVKTITTYQVLQKSFNLLSTALYSFQSFNIAP